MRKIRNNGRLSKPVAMPRSRPASLLLASLAALSPRVAQAITVTDCSDLAALKTTLEAGGTIVINCGVVTLDFGSEIVIDSDTTIDGLDQSTISGGDAHRVIRVVGSIAGVTVTLRGLNIVDGFVTGAYPAGAGGGVYSDGISGKQVALHLERMSFSGNAANLGGAVYSDGFDGSATLTTASTTFSGNAATGSGGAIFNDGYAGSATLTATNTTFSGNSASYGGAVYNYGDVSGSTTVETTTTTFSGNWATAWGGAVYNYGSGGNATVETTDTTFSGNSATYGGAVMNNSTAIGSTTLTTTNTTFSDNSATYGGAVYNFGNTATVETTNTTFSANSASYGGAVFNYNGVDSGSAALETTNTTFSGNSANLGGAVYSIGGGGSAVNTFTATIFATSTGNHCTDAGGSTFTSNDFNLADATDNSCNLSTATDQVVPDAGLAPLADNGGPTQTHALLSTSPAIDAASCFQPADQRGIARPQDGDANGSAICDIGAVERIGAQLLGTSIQRFPSSTRILAGERVQVYFRYDGNQQTDILVNAQVQPVNCRSGQPLAGAQPATSEGLTWQRNYSRYVFVWRTDKNWPVGCRQLVLTFADGSELRLQVEIVKRRW